MTLSLRTTSNYSRLDQRIQEISAGMELREQLAILSRQSLYPEEHRRPSMMQNHTDALRLTVCWTFRQVEDVRTGYEKLLVARNVYLCQALRHGLQYVPVYEKLPTATVWTPDAQRGSARVMGNHHNQPYYPVTRVKWLQRHLCNCVLTTQKSLLLTNHKQLLSKGSGTVTLLKSLPNTQATTADHFRLRNTIRGRVIPRMVQTTWNRVSYDNGIPSTG